MRLWLVALMLFSCTTVAQHVIAPDPYPTPIKAPAGREVRVAQFLDSRLLENPLKVGRRGDEGIPILLPTPAASLVTQEVKDYLSGKGFRVREETPPWDLTPEGLDPSWGGPVVGGKVERLWVEVGGGLAPLLQIRVDISFAVAEGGKVERRRVEVREERRIKGFSPEKVTKALEAVLAEAIREGLSEIHQ